jgi:hypothetical protein
MTVSRGTFSSSISSLKVEGDKKNLREGRAKHNFGKHSRTEIIDS